MSRIHKEHLQAGYIFGDTINQESEPPVKRVVCSRAISP